jgi:hypothetical protein
MSDSRLGRVFRQGADRLAAAWRRVCAAEDEGATVPELRMLDGVVEPFLRELAASLEGANAVKAWSRTRGVLRISQARGVSGLHAEFAALRRCLADTVCTLGASVEDRALISESLDDALGSALCLARRVEDPTLPPPEIAFGGVVVELFERELRTGTHAPPARAAH